jgi:hypothetical protein
LLEYVGTHAGTVINNINTDWELSDFDKSKLKGLFEEFFAHAKT